MGFKDKIAQSYTNNYIKKYGDRLTQAQGKVLNIKVERKTILWIFNKIMVTIIVKPDRSKNIVKTYYNKNRWFKKPNFINISQGHSLMIQGLKGKKGKDNREQIQILNIINMTNKQQLVPVEGQDMKKIKDATKVKYKNR